MIRRLGPLLLLLATCRHEFPNAPAETGSKDGPGDLIVSEPRPRLEAAAEVADGPAPDRSIADWAMDRAATDRAREAGKDLKKDQTGTKDLPAKDVSKNDQPFCPEGAQCVGMYFVQGVCHGGICCTGCWDGIGCQVGYTTGACGKGGTACKPCSSANPCQAAYCPAGVCAYVPLTDGSPCTSAGFSGQCRSGTCCAGCWDGACQPGNQPNACGTAGVACTNCGTSVPCISGSCMY